MEAVVDTSTLAERVTKPSDKQQIVLDVLIAHSRHGIDLVCAFEIGDDLRRITSKEVAPGWVTARLDELRKKGAADIAEEKRRNPRTGKLCQQWFIPKQQARLFS